MRIAHVSLTARDADRLAQFYRDAFDLEDRRPPRNLSGCVFRGDAPTDSDLMRTRIPGYPPTVLAD